jgi:hypothetical protein
MSRGHELLELGKQLAVSHFKTSEVAWRWARSLLWLFFPDAWQLPRWFLLLPLLRLALPAIEVGTPCGEPKRRIVSEIAPERLGLRQIVCIPPAPQTSRQSPAGPAERMSEIRAGWEFHQRTPRRSTSSGTKDE